MIIERERVPILSIEEWSRTAPPKGGDAHWVEGRSARELAQAWCGPGGPCVPPEVERLLRSHPDLTDVTIERVLPEHKVRFDDLPGEPRNADLAIEARDRRGVLAITAEGKADEPFDRRVSAILDAAAARIAADERTGAIARIQALAAALLPPWRDGQAHLGELRYQLLTGVAGTLAWAREIGAARAVFIVHEFVTDKTADDNHHRNAADLEQFLGRLTNGKTTRLEDGTLIGAIHVPGGGRIPSVPLYVGKAVRTVRSLPTGGTGA